MGFSAGPLEHHGRIFLLHVVGLLAFLTASLVLSDRRYFTPGVAALLIAGIGGWKWLKMYSTTFFSAAMLESHPTRSVGWFLVGSRSSGE